MAATLIDQLKAEGLDQPHLVGLSLGGWVVLEMAALGYGRSVLALAPAGLWTDGQKIVAERWTSFMRHGIPPLGRALPRLAAIRPVKRLVLRSLVHDPNRVSDEQLRIAAVALGQARGYRVCDRAAVHNRFTGAAKVGVPTTVAFGDDDRILPSDSSQNRALLPSHSKFMVIPDCGHAMTWDRPHACVQLIERAADDDPLAP
jgi:pimeloyl-ACP methyl ester carboxylesterase